MTFERSYLLLNCKLRSSLMILITSIFGKTIETTGLACKVYRVVPQKFLYFHFKLSLVTAHINKHDFPFLKITIIVYLHNSDLVPYRLAKFRGNGICCLKGNCGGRHSFSHYLPYTPSTVSRSVPTQIIFSLPKLSHDNDQLAVMRKMYNTPDRSLFLPKWFFYHNTAERTLQQNTAHPNQIHHVPNLQKPK